MKTINIRFVKRQLKQNEWDYLIQRRTWWGGWKYIGWVQDWGYARMSYLYCANTKQDLLKEVLEKYYKTDKRFVKIVEYPALQTY
mgnify:FL=1